MVVSEGKKAKHYVTALFMKLLSGWKFPLSKLANIVYIECINMATFYGLELSL